MKTLGQKLRGFTPRRRQKIQRRATELINEEMSLQDLRRAHKLTQKHVAEVLGIGQDSVSRLEQRSDLLISTLRSYVEAMGGHLSIVAEFPDHGPVILAGIAEIDSHKQERNSR